jgi:hypothetical protein
LPSIAKYEIDVGDDGVYDLVDTSHDVLIGGTSVVNAPIAAILGTPVDDGLYPARLRVTPQCGAVQEAAFLIEILNTPPEVWLEANDDDDGADGQWFVTVTDPGPDTVQLIEIDWGDGETSQLVAGDPPYVSHAFQSPGEHEVYATATDEDGTFGSTMCVEVSPFAFQPIPNPAPLYNVLMKQVANRQTKEFADAKTIERIRQQWSGDQLDSGLLDAKATATQPYGFDLGALSRWETREEARLKRKGCDVEFTTTAYLTYGIIGGISDGAGSTYGEVTYRYHVYEHAKVTNRATGAATTSGQRIWSSAPNVGTDGTYKSGVTRNPNPPSLP